MSDRDLVREISETSAKLTRLVDEFVRNQRETEEEREAEQRRVDQENRRVRRNHQEALKVKDAWREELPGLEKQFGRRFDALSTDAQEAEARRVMNDIDFARWKRSPKEDLYRHALLTGLLNEDSDEVDKIGQDAG